ncbi:hypothetical protein DMUE_5709 [Dictyocoela muelleri]|nr:hypothetical protein DMUE_5709 [Dictyocoela muelleri]
MYLDLALILIIIRIIKGTDHTSDDHIYSLMFKDKNEYICPINNYNHDSLDNIRKSISSIVSKYPNDNIYETILTKNVCISDAVKFKLADSLERIAQYLNKKFTAEKKISGRVLKNIYGENIDQIRQLLNNLATQIQEIQAKADTSMSGYISQVMNTKIEEMVNEISNKIDNLINDIKTGGDPIDSAAVDEIVKQGNTNVVTQIMAEKVASTATGDVDSAADAVMNKITYTDPTSVTDNIDSQIDTYLKALQSKFQTLLNDIISILEKYTNEIEDLIRQIIDHESQNSNDQINALKNRTLQNINPLISKSQNEAQKTISAFLNSSNNDFNVFISELFIDLKNSSSDIFKHCKRKELAAFMKLIQEKTRNILFCVSRLINH